MLRSNCGGAIAPALANLVKSVSGTELMIPWRCPARHPEVNQSVPLLQLILFQQLFCYGFQCRSIQSFDPQLFSSVGQPFNVLPAFEQSSTITADHFLYPIRKKKSSIIRRNRYLCLLNKVPIVVHDHARVDSSF